MRASSIDSRSVRRVRVALADRAYDVRIAPQGIPLVVRALASHRGRVAVVTDAQVAKTVWPRIAAALRRHGATVPAPIVLPAGESTKSWRVLAALHRRLLDSGVDRQSCLVALGGGVVLDLAGFAAATFQRGIDWLAVPTTLLGMVDAAVGGKTGIDLDGAKNIVGAFHQPRAVLAGTDFLASLPARERINGLAEVVKYGMIADRRLFASLERTPRAWRRSRPRADAALVARCVAIKARVVAADERESGARALLNFGHTVGHALELQPPRRLLHGEAVGLGMLVACALAESIGIAREPQSPRLRRLLAELGLPVVAPRRIGDAAMARALRRDKKSRGGVPRFVLTSRIGAASVGHRVPEELLFQALRIIYEPRPLASPRNPLKSSTRGTPRTRRGGDHA